MNDFNLFTYENWRDVVGYEKLYQVSTWGRVRSCDTLVNAKCGSMRLRKGRILRQELIGSGYQIVCLYKDGKRKKHLVHRLVSQAFIPNPQHFKEVNHLNEVKTDNRASNLEWCSRSYNCNFGTRNERISKRVAQINPQTNEVLKIWSSTRECERNGFHHSAISDCCLGKLKTHHGYKWSYIKDSI